jgi:hypothetical protein
MYVAYFGILQCFYTDFLKMCRSYNVTTFEVPEKKEATNSDTTVVVRTAPPRPR